MPQEKPEVKKELEKGEWERFAELDAIEAPVDSMGVASFSADGKFIIGNEGSDVKVLNSATGAEVARFKSGVEVSSLVLRRDGTLFIGDGNGDLRFFDVRQGQEFKTKFQPLSSITAMTMFGDKVIFAGQDQGIKEFDMAAKEPHMLMSARERISAIAVAPDFRIAYGGKKGVVEVGDPATKSYDVSIDFQQGITALTFAPGGKLVVGLESGAIKILDSRTGEEIKTLEGHLSEILSLAVNEKNQVVSASKDGSIRTWGAK